MTNIAGQARHRRVECDPPVVFGRNTADFPRQIFWGAHSWHKSPCQAAHQNGRESHTAAAGSPATAAPAVPGKETCDEESPSPDANEAIEPGGARNTTTAGQDICAGEGGHDVHAEECGHARSLSEVVAEAIRRGDDRPLGFLTEDSARDLEARDPLLATFSLEELAIETGERAAHGKAWIERAQLVTLRRLEAKVAWAQDRRDQANSFEYPAPPPLDLNLGDVVADTVTKDVLQMRAQAPGPNDPIEAYLPCVQIEFFAPESMIELAEDAMLRLGGGNERDNRVTVCAAHHLHGLHRGRVRAYGAAPHDIVWEIGCRFGGDGPLARLFGDRYV